MKVPFIAAEWMAYVRGRSGVEATRFAARVQESLEHLTVADLKAILKHMAVMQFVRRSRYGPPKLSHARKHDIALCIQRYFYEDDAMLVECKASLAEIEINMNELKLDVNRSDATQGVGPAQGNHKNEYFANQRSSQPASQLARSSSKAAIPLQNEVIVVDDEDFHARRIQSPNQPSQTIGCQVLPAGSNAFPPAFRPFMNPMAHTAFRYPQMHGCQSSPHAPQLNQVIRSPAMNSMPPGRASHAVSANRVLHQLRHSSVRPQDTIQSIFSMHNQMNPNPPQPPASNLEQSQHCNDSKFVRVKQEYEDPDEIPKNQNEYDIMMSLLQMGFQDRREIMDSIRRLEIEGSLSVDDVMVDIIKQREEAEEARKMDEARKESEMTRKREAAKRKRAAEEAYERRIRAASFCEWISEKDMFPNSWLIKGNASSTLEEAVASSQTIKCKLLELLNLEKKAMAWYGKILPRDYFAVNLTQKFSNLKNHSIMQDSLVAEVRILEDAMYTLSEQQGGVPRIFLQVHDDVANSNRPTENGIGDDDVVLVPSSPPSQRLKASSLPEENETRVLLGTPEIIEIQ